MKYKYLNILPIIALVLACLSTPVYAKQGESCANPIVLVPDYRESVLSAGTVWYIANTFDLPMAIDFYPSNANSAAPKLELDFGCTPGEYDDPILCSLFCKSNSAYISMPHTETPPKSYDDQGKVRYHVEFGEFYRDMLLKQGIDYNIPVYIKVTYSGSGSLQMQPDAFNNCMDGPKFMHLGDTVNVQAQDKNRHVIVPYVQWQYDSIRYVWNGTAPCTLAIGNKCGFDPTDAGDGTIMDGGVIQPGGQFKVSSALLMQYVSDQKNYPNDAGMYFAKFYSEEPGVMKIEKIPAPAPQADAILLKYGQEADIHRNDTAALYAMPDSWVKDMQFYTPTDHIFKMYIGATPDFYLKDAVATYQFDRTYDGHRLSLMASDLSSIWSYKKSGSNYMYVRFECSTTTTVLPTLWTPSDCMSKVTRIEPAVQFDVAAKSNKNYSLYYADWKGGDMTIAWTNTQTTCPFYIADTCNVPNSDVSPVFYTNKAPKKSSITIPMDTVDSWESKVDPDGYLYIRFYAQAKGKITVTTSAPEEEDPQCDTYDSILTVSAWDSYEWRGTTYITGGTYHKNGNVDPETKCADTLYILRLTIHTTGHGTYEETGCDSIIYNGKKYTESGIYTDTLYKANGNRTIMTLDFTIHHATTGEQTVSACDSYEWNNTTYTESGDYKTVLTNAAGCDSTVTLHLTIYEPQANTDTTAIVWDSIVWYGTTYKTSGEYPLEMIGEGGCTWTHTLHLTVHTTSHDNYMESGCDSIIYNGKKYTESGIFADTLYDASGNRTVMALDFTVYHATTGEQTVSACDAYEWNETTYTESGDYNAILTNVSGCDSIVTLHLTIHTSNANTDTVAEVWDSIVWYGTTYKTSGEYPLEMSGEGGCTWTHTLHLTVHTTRYVVYEYNQCDSLIFHDRIYTESGEYIDTIMEVDSNRTITALHLTIRKTSYDEVSVALYEPYSSPSGKIYTESGDYTDTISNAAGCDSIITTHLTIYKTTYDTIEPMTGCDSIVYEGKTYTQSIAYNDTITAANGDRTIKSVSITINHTTYSELSVTKKGEYISPGGITYTESGDYTETITNVAGCDSIITLHVTISELIYDTVYFCRGYNREHDVQVNEILVRRYLPYTYEVPSSFNYREGMILEKSGNQVLVDFNIAEANLYDHYTHGLTPIQSIAWSIRYPGTGAYEPIIVEEGPQWINFGTLAVQIQFRCGETYNDALPMGIEETEAAQQPVKRIENGQVVIIRGGAAYTLMGQRICNW